MAAVALAPPARADGDPASEVLLGESVFYPYSPAVSIALQNKLSAEAAAAARAHFPIKIALIASPPDLGVIPVLFDKPHQYAKFLEQEISFQGRAQLLVVMPDGYGVQGLSPAATAAIGSLAKPAGTQPNDLAGAAINAVRVLATAAGHPIRTSDASSAAESGGHSRTLLLIVLALAAVGTAASVLVLRARESPSRGRRVQPRARGELVVRRSPEARHARGRLGYGRIGGAPRNRIGARRRGGGLGSRAWRRFLRPDPDRPRLRP